MPSINYVLLLQAQYLNLLDRMVRNHESRKTPAQDEALTAFRAAATEVFMTFVDYAIDDTLPSEHHRRQNQAQKLAETIHTVLDRPYDGSIPNLICNEVGQFLSAYNQTSTYNRSAA